MLQNLRYKNVWLLNTITFFIVIFLFSAPFSAALFNGNGVNFEGPLLTSVAYGSFALLLLALFIILNSKNLNILDLLTAIIWLLPLIYFISYWSAASKNLAVFSILLHVLYASFFLFGYFCVKQQKSRDWLTFGTLSSGALIILFGFGNLLGFFEYKDAIMGQGLDYKITSVFQYSNSYAAYLIGFLLAFAFAATNSRNKWITLFSSFFLVPAAVSLLLTLSRGAYLIVPLIILIVLFLLTISKQIEFLLILFFNIAISLTIMGWLTNVGRQIQQEGASDLSVTAAFALIGVSLIGVVCTFLIKKYAGPKISSILRNIEQNRGSAFFAPVLMVGIVLLLILALSTGVMSSFLPENLNTRIENININQNSVLERITFYKDSIKIVSDYPFFGAGGGGWASLYEQYQSNPYIARQAHSSYLQYLVEIGFVGLFFIVLFLISAFISFLVAKLKNNLIENSDMSVIFFIIPIAIIIHSFIDFDLSFGYLSCLLFLSAGAIIGLIKVNNTKSSFAKKFRYIPYIYAILIFLAAITVITVSVQKIDAHNRFSAVNQMIKDGQVTDEAYQLLNQSISKNPTHPLYTTLKLNILKQMYVQSKDETYYNDAKQLLKSIRKSEPNNRALLELEYDFLLLKDNLPDAALFLEQERYKFQWDISFYERLINLYAIMGQKAAEEQERNQQWSSALKLYEEVKEKRKYLESLPEEQSRGRPFYATPKITLPAGKIHFLNGDYNKAELTIRSSGIDEDFSNEFNREVARWYMASLHMQKKTNKQIYQKLINEYPEEEQLIEQLMK